MTTAGTGAIIKQLRTARGLSQMDLATALGYKDRTTIAKIESGAIEPSIGKMEEIAQYFNVSLAYLRNTLERSLYSLDYEVTHTGDSVYVTDDMGRDAGQTFSAAEWEDLKKTGEVSAVIRIMQGKENKKTPDTQMSIEGLPENKRWLIDYVMSLSDDEVKQLRGVVEFVRSQRG